ncbi:histone [Nanoarchaeota archaeon NZ13-N]|uniref:Histone n=1 Tax=Candidatus Nanoclepta minutus TaxID=1940235 RepID=A0A397WNG5_9ARCH|nr:MAG: histone [Nanoarchaeota archaeon NZ13-N]RIB35615.1 MAG: histone [Candidatus Nanoclepta minutus]
MAKRVTPIPIAPLYKILRKAGASRVSEEAKKAFVEAIVEIADRVSERAVDLAKHAGRRTVQEEDVKLAWKEVVRQ